MPTTDPTTRSCAELRRRNSVRAAARARDAELRRREITRMRELERDSRAKALDLSQAILDAQPELYSLECRAIGAERSGDEDAWTVYNDACHEMRNLIRTRDEAIDTAAAAREVLTSLHRLP